MSDPDGQVFVLSTSASGEVGQGTGDPPPGSDEDEEQQP
jgi:hypothetical protein